MSSSVAVSLLAEDDLLGRRIRGILRRDGIRVTERVASAEELSDTTPAVANAVILAGHGDVASHCAAIHALTRRLPSVACVLVASVAANGVRKVLDAGAAAVVLERDAEATLAPTVRAAAANLTVVPRRFRQDAARAPLSHREKQTLILVAHGLTNREIADQLYLAESTIKTHLASIFGKLGVGSRSEAAALVLDPSQNLGLGLLDVAHR